MKSQAYAAHEYFEELSFLPDDCVLSLWVSYVHDEILFWYFGVLGCDAGVPSGCVLQCENPERMCWRILSMCTSTLRSWRPLGSLCRKAE